MSNELKHESYNDGILEFGKIESTFNENRKKIGESFSSIGKLFFAQMSCRDNDIMQASSMGYVIDIKVKVPFRKEINSKNKVKIDNETYDIKKIDSDKNNVYLYLQKVGM